MLIKRIAIAAIGAGLISTQVQAQTEIQWWHSMTGALNDRLNDIANGFNASQKEYKIVPVYKGSYPESMTAAIAAFRAGSAPHILQVFEVGTATMMSAKGAIKPVYLMIKEAGLDPQKPPRTWKEFAAAAGKLKAAGQACVYTTGWPAWVHVENFSAWHNLPIGTRENGIGGLDTRFTINSPAHVEHVAMLADYAKQGWFTYSGRRNEAEARFFSGECAMLTSSSGAQANIRRNAKFDFSVNFLPYHDEIKGAPQNSIIGGATLWVMSGKKPAEYKGVTKFFTYLSSPAVQADWHKSTGYVPITNAAFEATKKEGYYEKVPGADIAVRQLNNKPPTPNSKGLRFGNYVQGREVIEEEMEGVFAGKKDAKTALDEAVRRGDEILRKFESSNRS